MQNLTIHTDERVDRVFENYPKEVRPKMEFLRKLVRETAQEMEDILQLQETLKWSEPSFVTKHGSTLRMDWKDRAPDQYAMYFQCTSRLVETFQIAFGDTFNYEGKRALIFNLEDDVPVEELKKCIKASLHYHKVKEQLTLGI